MLFNATNHNACKHERDLSNILITKESQLYGYAIGGVFTLYFRLMFPMGRCFLWVGVYSIMQGRLFTQSYREDSHLTWYPPSTCLAPT